MRTLLKVGGGGSCSHRAEAGTLGGGLGGLGCHARLVSSFGESPVRYGYKTVVRCACACGPLRSGEGSEACEGEYVSRVCGVQLQEEDA